MNILFKNKTKYTKQTYKKYLEFHQQKYGLKYKFHTITIILLLCFCIICNITSKNFLLVCLLLFALAIFCFYRFFYPIKKIQKELKTKKFKKEQEFTFSFYKNFFIISDGKNSERIKYWKLHKVFETNEFFYLYMNKDHSFLLNKSSFIKGAPSAFSKFIKQRTWYKI